MKNTIFYLLILVGAGMGTALALPDVYYCFDDLDDPVIARDLGDAGLNMKIIKNSHISDKDPRFGEGCLLLEKSVNAATAGFYSTLSRSPEFSPETNHLTISIWLSLVDDDPFPIFGRGSFEENKVGRFMLRIDGGQRLVFSVGKTDLRSTKLSLPSHGEWFHVAVTFSEGEVSFYFNGELVNSEVLDVSEIFEVSGGGAISLGLNGREGVRFDDVAFIGSEALDSEEIQKIYKIGLKQYISSKKP
ncbi:MAG: LamG domain-containing protein [Chthoniobacterales bacterium]